MDLIFLFAEHKNFCPHSCGSSLKNRSLTGRIAKDDIKHILVGPGSDCVQDNLDNLIDIVLGDTEAW